LIYTDTVLRYQIYFVQLQRHDVTVTDQVLIVSSSVLYISDI